MRFSQRKCSSREVLQPLDCYGGNPCPTAIPYQADSLGGRISADEQGTVLYGRVYRTARTLFAAGLSCSHARKERGSNPGRNTARPSSWCWPALLHCSPSSAGRPCGSKVARVKNRLSETPSPALSWIPSEQETRERYSRRSWRDCAMAEVK